MGKFNRLISALCAVMILTPLIPTGYAEEEERIASAHFGLRAETKAMKAVFGESNSFFSNNTVVEREDRTGWSVKPNGDWYQGEILLNLDESFVGKGESYQSYQVEVDYFDEGNGKFRLLYDGLAEPWIKGGGKQTKRSEVVYLKNTKMWKTFTYIVEAPRFRNGYKDADLAITMNNSGMGWSREAVIIGDVRVKPVELASPVRMNLTTEAIGNNFFNTENVSIKLEAYNKSNINQNTEVSLKAYNLDGELAWEDKFPMEITAGGSFTKQIEFKPDQHSIFKLYAQAEGENNSSSAWIEFSYCVESEKLNPVCGTNDHVLTYPTRDTEKLFTLMERAGIGMSRGSSRWYNYEQKKGQFGNPAWINERIDFIANSEVEQFWVIGHTNKLYGPGWVQGEEMEAACLEHIRRQVTEYKGKIKYVEIFNEVASAIQPGCDAKWYANLAKQAYTIIKNIDPDIYVVIGATSEVPVAWINEVCSLIPGYFDAFSIHPYSWLDDPISTDRYNIISTGRKAMDSAGAEDIPLWCSEVGWPTAFVTPEEQAAYITQFYAVVSPPELKVDRIQFYDFQDDGIEPQEREHNFGIIKAWEAVDTPHLAKPAYLATSNMNNILTGAKYHSSDIDKEDNVVMYHFKRDTEKDKDVLMMWAHPDNACTTLSLGTDDAKIYDMYGTELDIWNKDGKYSLSLDYRPIYVVGDFKEVSKVEPIVDINGVAFDIPSDDVLELTLTKKIDDPAEVKVELDKDSRCEVAEVSEFIDGKATAKIKVKGDVGESETITLNIQGADGTVYGSFAVKINFTEAVTMSIRTKPYSADNLTRWVSEITLTNNNKSKSIRGKIQFEGPTDIREKIGAVVINEIPADSSAEIKFHLPQISAYTAYNMKGKVILDDGYRLAFDTYVDCSAAMYMDQKPTVDGVRSPGEYYDEICLELNKEHFYADYTFAKDVYTGNQDQSAKIYLGWDEKNFYMFAEVTDDTFYQDQTSDGIWMGDSIQLGMNYTGVANPEYSLFTELGIGLTPNGEYLARYSNEGGVNSTAKSSECSIKNVNGVTCYELCMPWNEIIAGVDELQAGDAVRYNLIVNENDAKGRYGWLEYSSGIGQVKDGRLFGYLNLMKN